MPPTVDLYYHPYSPYCRSILLLGQALEVDLNLKTVDLFKQEQKTPEFLKLNRQHAVPVMVDGDHKLCESRAIMTYLASKYGKEESLYPKDLTLRSKVDALLNFDLGTLEVRWKNTVYKVLVGGATKPPPGSVEDLKEAIGWLNDMIGSGDKFAAGTDRPTVADYALVAQMPAMQAGGFLLFKDYPNVDAWIMRCEKAMDDYLKLNGENAMKIGELIKSKIKED